MKNFLSYIKRIFYVIKLKKNGSKVSINSWVNDNTKLEGKNNVEDRVNIFNSNIGFASVIGANSYLPNTKIGKYTSIAQDTKLILGAHPTHTFVSTHAAFYNPDRIIFSYIKEKPKALFQFEHIKIDSFDLIIGNDVWIGNGVKILPGLKIGDGAIIGTGSVVTKNIPPYAIAVGVPAKVIKYRFSDYEIDHLIETKWWNKEPKDIEKEVKYYENIKEFLKR